MAKERLKSPRARLFVALDLPEEVRDQLLRWQREELSDEPALRLTRPEALHMTLVFLGYHPERDVERIAELSTAVSSPAPEIRLGREPVGVPRGKRRPRLLALEARGEGAMRLQVEIAGKLEDAGFYTPEKRPFWPHLTVARVRAERRGSRHPALISRPPGPLPESLTEPFSAVRVALYRSILRPTGAEYVPVATTDLPPGG